MAVTSELIYCFSAVTISRGDVESGEPEVIIGLHSAESSAARWDYRKNRIKYGFTIVSDLSHFKIEGKLQKWLKA